MLRGLTTVVLTVICLVAGAASARGQAGTVSGRVFDQSGLPVPGATVTLLTADRRAVQATQTALDGSFLFDGVPQGALVVSVQLAGFLTTEVPVAASPAGRGPLSVVLPVAGFGDTVTVTATREERVLAAIPSSVSVVAGSTLDRAPGVNLVEALKYVPGVVAGDVSGTDDLRISIRGAGIRAGFGSRGVVLMADGVPVTEPDGQTPHFDGQIDLSNAERVEVVKGPSSALYGGAALGGVVNVISRRPSRQFATSVAAEAGSFDFAKVHAGASGGAGPFAMSATFGYTHLDGFRAHNSLRNWMGTLRADWSSGSSRAIVRLLGSDASLELPGTLDREQFQADPAQVRPIYILNDWGRQNRLWRFGGQYDRQIGSSHIIEAGSYGQTRDLFHPIFVVIDQQALRHVGHARYRLTRGRHTLAVGVDADTQWVDDRWFVNSGGRPGFQIRDDDNTVMNLGTYVQSEIALGSRATAVAGLRADTIRYDLRDRAPQADDASDRRTFRRFSPKLGLTLAARSSAVLYANVSTGFEAPTLGEVRLPAGFNDQVQPQTAVSVEGGVRGGSGAVSYDVSVYRMVVNDEILPETVQNVTVYRNVAVATHAGLEVSGRARVMPWLSVAATYGYARFTLDEFDVFSGNRLPGVPSHTGTVRADLSVRSRWDGFLALVAASSAFVNDANTESASRYGVVSTGAAYRMGPVRLFVRGENLGNARYTNRVQVNDTSGFYFYPAPGRHAGAGVDVRW
jgi:iron complex outermembrane recepter protein